MRNQNAARHRNAGHQQATGTEMVVKDLKTSLTPTHRPLTPPLPPISRPSHLRSPARRPRARLLGGLAVVIPVPAVPQRVRFSTALMHSVIMCINAHGQCGELLWVVLLELAHPEEISGKTPRELTRANKRI